MSGLVECGAVRRVMGKVGRVESVHCPRSCVVKSAETGTCMFSVDRSMPA